jgi:hypothetical protein
MSIEAMKLALEALAYKNSNLPGELHYEAITALRAAIEQAEKQKPVAWADKYDIEREGHDFYVNRQQPSKDGVPLYTAPPQREWQGLTDEEIGKVITQSEITLKNYCSEDKQTEYARAIESKLKEKNA